MRLRIVRRGRPPLQGGDRSDRGRADRRRYARSHGPSRSPRCRRAGSCARSPRGPARGPVARLSRPAPARVQGPRPVGDRLPCRPQPRTSRSLRTAPGARRSSGPSRPMGAAVAPASRATTPSGRSSTRSGSRHSFNVNDMPQHRGVQHHAALSVAIEGQRYLADVGLGPRARRADPAARIRPRQRRSPGLS